ncbi:MAG: GyrI-like domain-containing protein [Oscillospiraceae bacterium]|nr:GyrI-like domain-containing protein [Oscillospiraceae bacterium]
MPIDFKKQQQDLYQPKTNASIVDVPEMVFIAVDGKGDPNTSEEYAAAIEVLYGLSYGIKMSNKAILEYVVAPLEGLWSVDGEYEGCGISEKDKFYWTALIRQPEFVTAEIFEAAKTALAKKKSKLDTSKARLVKITEGLCVQAMHIGSYDDEPTTIAAMEQYAAAQGYTIDMSDIRRHHEIYLSDPRKVAPEKLKTVIRHPVRNRKI